MENVLPNKWQKMGLETRLQGLKPPASDWRRVSFIGVESVHDSFLALGVLGVTARSLVFPVRANAAP